MDLKNNNQQFISLNAMTNEPCLPFNALNDQRQSLELLGASDDLWTPYTNFRTNAIDCGTVNLPIAMLNDPNMNLNNNFDGTLEADESSYYSYSLDDSDTFSDVELTDSSEEEDLETRNWTQGASVNDETFARTTTTTTLKTDSILANEQLVHQQIIQDDIISIIREDGNNNNNRSRLEESSRPSGPVEGGSDFSFSFNKAEKAKPMLPGAALLQGLAASSWSHNLDDVVVHKCDEDCECMEIEEPMYYQQQSQSQNSF